MISILGAKGDMNNLEIWFQRGKKINPDDEALYEAKLNYLQPRWSGSEEKMLQFGRQCVKEGRWDSRIPFILLSAHHALAGDTAQERRPYFAQPEVWQEIEPLFKTYLARHPSDYIRMGSYVNYAGLAGKWDLVSKLMHEHGWDIVSFAIEDPTVSVKADNFRDFSTIPAYLK